MEGVKCFVQSILKLGRVHDSIQKGAAAATVPSEHFSSAFEVFLLN